MSHPRINKVVKLLPKLIISILFTPILSCAQNLSKNDSLNLKKDIDSLLSKYGFKDNPYVINVQSKNQKGGQTAFIINNNYYGDSILASNNFGYRIDTSGTTLNVSVYPLKGIWQMPYIGIDTSDFNSKHQVGYDPGAGTINFADGVKLKINDTTYNLVYVIRGSVCSKNNPMLVTLKTVKSFFTFGDYTDDNKNYIFSLGTAWSLTPTIHK